jgi:MYXO-CTERM domain-containing protein
MRAALAILAIAVLPAASADACSEATPCVWYVDVFEGIEQRGTWEVTLGDWWRVNATNFEDQARTLQLEAVGMALRVPSLADAQSAAFRFCKAGDFVLTDDLGRTAPVRVTAADSNDAAAGLSGAATGNPCEAKASPTPPAMAILLALGLLAARRR